jgi:hypothetical protein
MTWGPSRLGLYQLDYTNFTRSYNFASDIIPSLPPQTKTPPFQMALPLIPVDQTSQAIDHIYGLNWLNEGDGIIPNHPQPAKRGPRFQRISIQPTFADCPGGSHGLRFVP